MERERVADALASRVLDDSPVMVVYVDSELTIVVCNKAGAGAFRRSQGEVIGRPLFDLIRPDSQMAEAIVGAMRTRLGADRLFTTMIASSSDEPRTFAGSLIPDLDEGGAVRGVFISALDVTGGVSDLRMAARLAQSLGVILQAIARMDDPIVLLDILAAESLEAVRGVYSLVSVRNDRSWVVTHSHGVGGEERVGIEYPLDERPVLCDAADSGEIQFIEDAQTHARTNKDIMRRFGIESFVAVPLTLRGETLGVFEIVFDRRRVFDAATRDYLSNIASAASLVYGRMRDYRHEHRIADALQAALLRLPTDVRGIRFASHYAAASDEALVGGDFFDVFEIDGARVGVTVGDVSGKGLSAAIITSRVRDSLRLCALEGLSPAECVTKTNRLLYRVTPPDVFATLVFGILNTVSGHLTYVSAAHPPGVLHRADGTIVLLEGPNSVVGAFEWLEFVEASVTVEAGDALVLFTDGLTEARRDGEMYGLQRLIDFLTARKRSSLEMLVSEVFSNSRLRDDVAMLAIALDRPVGSALRE
jgi:GAF domain-containing protein